MPVWQAGQRQRETQVSKYYLAFHCFSYQTNIDKYKRQCSKRSSVKRVYPACRRDTAQVIMARVRQRKFSGDNIHVVRTNHIWVH